MYNHALNDDIFWAWQIFFSLGFHNQVYICSKHTAQLVCILMPVKYAPTHTNWVGASTKGNTVDVLHVYRHPLGAGEAQWRLAQYPHSSPLTREGGNKIQRERERERDGRRESGRRQREWDVKRWRDADRSDRSSSRAAIDRSSWQGRSYENAKQSDLFTAAIITHTEITHKHTQTQQGAGYIQERYVIKHTYRGTTNKVQINCWWDSITNTQIIT